MKEISKKIIAIFVIMLMIINSSLLTIISVAAEDIKNVLDKSKAEVKNEINIEKYVNYSLEDNKGVLLKLDLKTGIEYKEDQEYKAIKQTQTELVAPQINGEFPEKVEIQAISTKATNGSNTAKDYDYKYDSNTGKIAIVVQNKEDDNHNIYTEKVDGARDNYKLNLYYSSNCYNENNEKRTIEVTGNVKEVLNTDDSAEISGDINASGEVTENISGLVSADIVSGQIYNGNINANINNGTKNPTTYSETMNINVDYESISDKIEITEDDKFVDAKDKEINTEEIKYKSTKVNKNNILDILGEDGKLQILNTNDEVLLEVNKDTQANEDGTIEANFENEEDSLKVKTSKPIKIGTLKIENTKEIKETYLNLDDNKIKTYTNVKAIKDVQKTEVEDNNTTDNIEEKEIYNFSNNYVTKINDSQTRVDLSVDKQNWTNNTVNDVNFTLKLISNDVKYNLFKNPVIEMKLPEDVDKVILGNTSLLNNDSNFIQNTEVVDNGTNKVIRVTLNGTQNNYYADSIYEGTYVVIPAKITLKSDLTANDSNIEVTYSNENGKLIDYVVDGAENKKVNIKELDEKQDTRLSTARYQIQTNEQNTESTQTQEENSVNNTTQQIQGLNFSVDTQVGNKVLKENDVVYEKQIITYKVKVQNNTGKELKDLKIVGKIPEGTTYVTVSKGEDDIEDMEKMYEYVGDSSVKQKEIAIESVEAGTTAERIYEVEVNQLAENSSEANISSDTTLYVNNKLSGEVKLSNIAKKSNIYARMVSTMGGFEHEDNKWQYYVLITNNTQATLKDVDISVNIPKWMEVYETGPLTPDITLKEEPTENGYYKAQIAELPVGEEVILRIYMQPKNLDKNVYQYELEVAGEISGQGIENYNTNLNYQIMQTREVVVTMSSESEGKEVKYEDDIEYNVNIKVNGNSSKFRDLSLNVLDYLPDGLLPEEVEYENWTYNEEKQTYEWSKETEDISSKIIEDGEEGTNPDVKLYITIPNGAEVNIKIKATVDLVSENKEVSNSVSVTTGESDTIISNTVKFTIKAGTSDDNKGDNPSDDGKDDNNNNNNNGDKKDDDNGNNDNNNNGDNNQNNSTYEISGQVWLDANKDGQKGEKEEKISGVTVKLFDTATNAIVTSSDGQKYIIKTDKEGKYKFSNLTNGKYLVIFEYDNKTYELTDYQKSGVSEDANSDAISKEISIDGKEETAGVTDVITIESKNIQNIDAGLIKGETLDLKLDKYVSKITVSNSKGSKDYDYQNQKLAKVEVASKQISNTTVTITYKIVVTNEGEKSAYISEITDYLPQGLEFNSVDGNWELQNDGSVKIHSLAGLLLKPGMSKEIEITAVATDVGKFVNGAEITLTKNDSNIKDIDSVEGNKDKNEDDYSEATVIVSVKTGAIIGASIGVILAAILVILFVILSKKNKKFRKFTKMSFLLLITTSTLTIMTTYTQAKTTAEKKQELKDKYTTSTTYNINSSSSHFYTHDTPQSTVINSGRLHCTDGTKSMCGSGDHWYKQKSVSVTKFDVKTNKSTANKYEATKNKSTGEKLDSTYNIYGPYKVERTNDKKITEDSIESIILYNTNGNKIGSSKWEICDKKGNAKEFSFNKEFYVKVSQKSEPANMKIKIKNNAVTEYKANWKVVEKWICNKTSGGTHKTHSGKVVGCSNHKNAQPLERVWTGSSEWSDTKPNSKTITLYMKDPPPPPEVGAKIQKVDDRDGTPLKGIGFQFSTTIKSYDWYDSTDIYHWVDHGHREYWYSSWTDSKGNTHYSSGSYWVSNWQYDYWYTINYYHWVDHTVYLNSSREWGYSASTFYTDDDGIASGQGTLNIKTNAWNDGSRGNNHTAYAYFTSNTITATETEVPEVTEGEEGYYGYTENIGSSWSIPRNGGTTVTAKNHQYRVMVSGYVWLDKENGKLSMTDSEFNGEEGCNWVLVKLKDRYGNTIQSTYTNEYGIYDEIEGGEYRFYNVSLDQIQSGNYHIEFEYCGIDYQSVNPEINSNEGSKASDTTSRQELDRKFSSVNGNGSQSLNVNGVQLNYNTTNQYQTSIIGHTGCDVTASTDETGYDLYSNFVPTAKEIRYVNLGLFKKEQTDYALAEDLYNVRVGVNGFQHVYRYASVRYQGWGDYTDEESAWNVGVKFQNNRGSYSRAIYKADYDYVNNLDKSKEISVYVTYKIALKNEGTYLGRINNIIDYCDSNYDIQTAGYSINDEDFISDNISVVEDTNANINGYKKYIVDTSARTIEAGEEQYLYIQFKMDKEAVRTIMNNGETKHNMVEINSYTTYDDDTGNPLAVYDIDSVPGNARVEDFSTYEDDTDSARSLQLEFKNERTVKGITFVDGTNNQKDLDTGNERLGDGKYTENSKDKRLANVDVTMTEVDSQGKKIQNGLVYTAKTNDKGEFTINNYVAGYYQITYTWGSKEYKVQYYKGTIYTDGTNKNSTRYQKTKSDPYWYRGSEYEDDTTSRDVRLTDALDNSDTRRKIDSEMESITKNTLEQEIIDAYEDGYNSQGKTIKTTKMDSTTPTIAFSVEYETTVTNGDDSDRVEFVIQNVDFGIVERARQQLELLKQVSGYKIKLANGQILVDAKIDENGKITGTYPYTIFENTPKSVDNTSPRGLLKTEMDNELIEGATIETEYTIKVKNVGEMDYTSQDYYYYGDRGNGSSVVRTSVTQLLDYVDGRLAVLDEKGDWADAEKDYEKTYNVSKNNDSTYINGIKQYVTKSLNKALAPKESSEVKLNTSKLLTSTDDNEFNNQSEITEVKKTNGFSTGTPVKMRWDNGQNHFNVANAEIVTIVPSTGENRNYVTPIMIGIVTISMLGVGIVLIKKFVVK